MTVLFVMIQLVASCAIAEEDILEMEHFVKVGWM